MHRRHQSRDGHVADQAFGGMGARIGSRRIGVSEIGERVGVRWMGMRADQVRADRRAVGGGFSSSEPTEIEPNPSDGALPGTVV